MASHADVSDFYKESLATQGGNFEVANVCLLAQSFTPHQRKCLELLPSEVRDISFGCATPVPSGIDGKTVVDLGSGPGRDCYLASVQVGPKGKVIGVDMTDDMLMFARKHVPAFAAKLGYEPDLTFVKGEIENLSAAGIAADSTDVCISNCVVNLATDKKAVLQSVYNILREGGEFYFSDIYSDRRLPGWAKEHKQLVGECLGGALYYRDFLQLAKDVGFTDPRVVSVSSSSCAPETVKSLHGVSFLSITFRLFKFKQLEASRENYGDTAMYLGTVPGCDDRYQFDKSNTFAKNVPLAVDRNLKGILEGCWLSPHFSVQPGAHDKDGQSVHLGPIKALEDDLAGLLEATSTAAGGGGCAPTQKPSGGGGCCAPTQKPSAGGCCAPTQKPSGGGCCVPTQKPSGGGCC